MASYGTNAAVQYLALKRTDSNLDNQTGAYRDIATSFINGKLNLTADISSPSDGVTRCANLLAAGLMMTSAQSIDEINGHPFIKMALDLLDLISGDYISDGGDVSGESFVVDRF
jgi:hypothetical protein